jgi:hypothetical protein
MSERGNQLATKSEKSYTDLIAFLSNLSEADLKAPCADPSGATVGHVAGHLAEGAEMLFSWGGAVLHGAPVPGGAPTGEHNHSHANITTATQLGDAVALFNRAGTAAISLLRFLTDEQLDSIAPAAEGISDGTLTLEQVIDELMDHQNEHLAFMQEAVKPAELAQDRT